MDEMAKEIGADRCIFQELPDLVASILEEAQEQGSSLKALDCSCFDGNYVTSNVGDDYLSALAATRNDSRGPVSNPAHYVDRLESSPQRCRAGGPN